MIEQQTAELIAVLNTARGEARAPQEAHKEKFMGESLQAIFDNLQHPLKKLSEATDAEWRPVSDRRSR